jgi:hypothetical protein
MRSTYVDVELRTFDWSGESTTVARSIPVEITGVPTAVQLRDVTTDVPVLSPAIVAVLLASLLTVLSLLRSRVSLAVNLQRHRKWPCEPNKWQQ